MEEFKVRLRRALVDSGMSQQELSNRTKIPKSSISQYLSGYSTPKNERLMLIANALQVLPAWLMGYSDNSNSYYGDENGLTKDVNLKVWSDEELLDHYHLLTRINKKHINEMIMEWIKAQTEELEYRKMESEGTLEDLPEFAYEDGNKE